MTLFMISIPFMPVAVGIASEFERHREQGSRATTHAVSMSMTGGRALTETAQEALTAL
jgi:hypothetical protein